MIYTTDYTASSGQPTSSHEIHSDLNQALARWAYNTGSLLHRSGGDSRLQAWESLDDESPVGTLTWLEHCEGAYPCAEGIFAETVCHWARIAEENGDSLTTEDVVRHLSLP